MTSSSASSGGLPWDHDLPMAAEEYNLKEICINSLWDIDRKDLAENHLLPVLRKKAPHISVSSGIPRHAPQTLFLVFDTEEEGMEARAILLNHDDFGPYSQGKWRSRIGFKIDS